MNKSNFAIAGTDLREQPLPPVVSICDTDDYQNIDIDPSAPEFNEALVDLSQFGIATDGFFAADGGLNPPVNRRFSSAISKVYARTGVAMKLVHVNRLLARYEVEVLVLDAFRPLPVQRELWQWFIGEARRLMPESTDDERERFALRYCSNPTHFNPRDAKTWPTHATGGALDLTLQDIRSRKPLFMGSTYLDPAPVSSTRYFESRNDFRTDAEARRNRRLLFWAMSAAGFVNYPLEWWHFDHLTQAWVMNQGCPTGLAARYGLANNGEPPR